MLEKVDLRLNCQKKNIRSGWTEAGAKINPFTAFDLGGRHPDHHPF